MTGKKNAERCMLPDADRCKQETGVQVVLEFHPRYYTLSCEPLQHFITPIKNNVYVYSYLSL